MLSVLQAVEARRLRCRSRSRRPGPRRWRARGCGQAPRGSCRTVNASVLAAVEAAPGPDPERAVAVLVERLGVAVQEARRVALVEDGELDAVESDEAALGAEPDVAVPRLEDRLDRVLRQARSVFQTWCAYCVIAFDGSRPRAARGREAAPTPTTAASAPEGAPAEKALRADAHVRILSARAKARPPRRPDVRTPGAGAGTRESRRTSGSRRTRRAPRCRAGRSGSART